MDDNYELFGDWFKVKYERKPSEQVLDRLDEHRHHDYQDDHRNEGHRG